MMTVALALMLLVGVAGEATARINAIRNDTPAVILDGDPEFPGVIERTRIESAPAMEAPRINSGDLEDRSPAEVAWSLSTLWSLLWRWAWALR